MHFSSTTISRPAAKVSPTDLLADGSAAPPATAALTRQKDRPLKSSRVLVVDDDENMLQLYEDLMARRGCEVDTADDGEAGWTALCRSNYDLVITDNDMPRLTGLELIKRLRAVSFDLPCILVSGQLPGPEMVLVQIIKPGAVLSKPVLLAVLMASVEKFLLAETECPLNDE